MSKKSQGLELFLYKTKLNTKTLTEVAPHLSSKTIELLLKDLQIFEKVEENVVQTDSSMYIFTDGGCKNNGKKNARAAYGVFVTDDNGESESPFNKCGLVISNPTNQRAELTAILRCLEILKEQRDSLHQKKIIIVTDSIYSINCITKWSKNWKTNGWRTSSGQQIKNKEIIVEITELLDTLQLNVEFKHVFSHTKEPIEKDTLAYKLWYGNYKVDKMINDLLEMELDEN